jgi:hypothetical protein
MVKIMPNRDGKGPEGKGPRTGRGLGVCEEKKENNLNKQEVINGKI